MTQYSQQALAINAHTVLIRPKSDHCFAVSDFCHEWGEGEGVSSAVRIFF